MKIDVNITLDFDNAWSELDYKQQQQVVLQNIDILSDDDLIDELESRGYYIIKEE